MLCFLQDTGAEADRAEQLPARSVRCFWIASTWDFSAWTRSGGMSALVTEGGLG